MIFVFHFLVLFSVLEFLQFLLRQALEWKRFISLFRFRNYHCFCTRSPSVNCSYLKEYFRVCLDVLQFLAFQKIIFWVAFTDFHFRNWVKKTFIYFLRFRNYHCFCTRSPTVNCSSLKIYFRVCLGLLHFLVFQKVVFSVALTDFRCWNGFLCQSFSENVC